MCDPVTGMMVVSTMLMGVGMVQQSSAANKQGKYQEKVGKQNAMIQNRIAEDAIKRGEHEEHMVRMRTAQRIGSQRAQMAASGLDTSVGDPVDILADTAEFGELDALTARGNAQREAFGYQSKATDSLTQARLDRASGRNTATATLLSGASNIAGSWATFGQAAGWGQAKT